MNEEAQRNGRSSANPRVRSTKLLRPEETAVKFRVLVELDEDGAFVAQVPSLPGCISQGKTRGEAMQNIKEAIAGYLESLRAHDEPLPPSIGEEVVDVPV